MESKHTPGPWVVSRGAQADPLSIEGPDRTVAHVKMERSVAQTNANARLISAAPDLLEVSRMAEAVAAMECGLAPAPDFEPRDMLDAARAAIAKATGSDR